MTIEEARAVFLSFPEAEEREHHGHPDFRVGGKIFGSFQPDRGVAVVSIPLELAEAIAVADSSKRLASRFGGVGWIAFQLSDVEAEELEALASLAFEQRRATR